MRCLAGSLVIDSRKSIETTEFVSIGEVPSLHGSMKIDFLFGQTKDAHDGMRPFRTIISRFHYSLPCASDGETAVVQRRNLHGDKVVIG
jgi:hypothetical protein